MTDQTYILVRVSEMVGRRARPQEVLDFVDFVWKLLYGEVLR